MKALANEVDKNIKEGKLCSLGYSQNDYAEIEMHSLYNSEIVTTNDWTEGGGSKGAGHTVFITGVADDGFIVSSWGRKYKIPFESLADGASFDISVSQVSGN